MTAESTPQTVTSCARCQSSTWRLKARSPRSLRSSRPIRSRSARRSLTQRRPRPRRPTRSGVGSLTAFGGGLAFAPDGA